MKRGGLARKVYERPARAPVVPVENCRGVIRPVSDVVLAVPKEVIHRSEAYRRYVASHECFMCRLEGYSQAAHANEGKGKGMKVCDSKVFPLCAPHHGLIGCHQSFDLYIDLPREEAREMGAAFVEVMQRRAMADGWSFGPEGIKRK